MMAAQRPPLWCLSLIGGPLRGHRSRWPDKSVGPTGLAPEVGHECSAGTALRWRSGLVKEVYVIVKSVDEQLALIRRGVESIVPEVELIHRLERGLKTGR